MVSSKMESWQAALAVHDLIPADVRMGAMDECGI
jgi:hypothetical protein